LRKKSGWSQECLAEEAGLHWTYIGGIEHGERNLCLPNVVKIARSLKVAPSELLDGIR